MSWEPVQEWPGEVRGDAFRTAAEPIIAQRRGRSWGERVRGFLASTDEERLSHLVDTIAITETRVYVERVGGARFRAPRSALIAQQQEGRKIRYGVYHGDDFALYARTDCPVEEILGDQLGAPRDRLKLNGTLLSMSIVIPAGLALTAFAGFSVWNTRNYDLAGLFADGLYTSEGALALYVAVGLLAAALLCWLLVPARTYVDALGVHRTRGVIPLLRWHLPVEEVADLHTKEIASAAIDIVAELKTPRRFGGLMKSRSCVLETIQVRKEITVARARARYRQRVIEARLAGRTVERSAEK